MNAKTLGQTRGISLMDREEKLLQSEASFERARRFHFTGIDSEEHLLCSLILGFLRVGSTYILRGSLIE